MDRCVLNSSSNLQMTPRCAIMHKVESLKLHVHMYACNNCGIALKVATLPVPNFIALPGNKKQLITSGTKKLAWWSNNSGDLDQNAEGSWVRIPPKQPAVFFLGQDLESSEYTVLNTPGVSWLRSRVVDSSSLAYRMCVRILARPVATLVSLRRAIYHKCFSPPRSTNGYQGELGKKSVMDWHPVQREQRYSQSFNANDTQFKH